METFKAKSLIGQFIKNELDAYAKDQRLHTDCIPFLVRAFEAYDEYKRLVSFPKSSCYCKGEFNEAEAGKWEDMDRDPPKCPCGFKEKCSC